MIRSAIALDSKCEEIVNNNNIHADGRVHEKEREKVEKYQELRREIGRLWQLKSVKARPVVIGALGSVTKEFDNRMEELELPSNVGAIQKTALLGTKVICSIVQMEENCKKQFHQKCSDICARLRGFLTFNLLLYCPVA